MRLALGLVLHHKKKGDYSVDQLIEQLTSVLFKSLPGNWLSKIYLMADDIDPSNLADVFWAFCRRCHPDEHRVYPNEDVPMAHLMGYLSEEEMANLKSSRIVYN